MDDKKMTTGAASAGQDLERNAFNLAFSELDLGWHWDEKTYSELQSFPAEVDRLRAYLQSRHGYLLKAYDVDFLVDAIRMTKARSASAKPELSGHTG